MEFRHARKVRKKATALIGMERLNEQKQEEQMHQAPPLMAYRHFPVCNEIHSRFAVPERQTRLQQLKRAHPDGRKRKFLVSFQLRQSVASILTGFTIYATVAF
jgi:hypothetical protein